MFVILIDDCRDNWVYEILNDLPGFAREIKVQDIINSAQKSLTDRELQTIKNFFS